MKSLYEVSYWFPSEEFAARRARVFDAIGPTACALIQGGGPVLGFEVFRQTNEFFYLCGVETPQAYLLLDGRTRTTALFVPGSSAEALGLNLDAVYGLDRLEEKLTGITTLYTPYAPPEGRVECRDVLQLYARTVAKDPWDAEISRSARFRARLSAVFPRAELHDLTPILDALRVIKSPREIELMRYTGKLTGLAVKEAMQATAPGLREYQLGAIADHLYREGGARREGYCAIIASGANIWDGHYNRNDCLLTDGDLVLMDYAPDVCNYTNDIGRMWPINGTFSAQQRTLYGFIVEYHKAVLKRIRPGVLPRELLAEAAEEMRGILEQTTFAKPIYAEAAQRTLTYRGHLSHPVGMAVHDVGAYFEVPMQVGLVISIDPQLWIPEEQLYFRVEDTIVVTETGCEVLTGHVPFEIDEIEALMQAAF
ncbi:aminopeptidase P N-terminal domain-containing protein [Armatimonas sp.]|uniref:aminopeptidase P N-terminal domain-containing protein n=1 Tax=Armatimonas sp. TaxID=1872638 RepID=UPI003751D420